MSGSIQHLAPQRKWLTISIHTLGYDLWDVNYFLCYRSPFIEGRWNFEWFGADTPGFFAAKFLFEWVFWSHSCVVLFINPFIFLAGLGILCFCIIRSWVLLKSSSKFALVLLGWITLLGRPWLPLQESSFKFSYLVKFGCLH